MGRLPHPHKERKYQLQELWDVHKEINRRLVLGQKQVEIAEELQVTPVMVSYTKNSNIAVQEREKLQAELDGVTVDVARRIKELGAAAVELLADHMSDPNTPRALSTRIAQDILDRAGYGAIQRSRNENLNCTLGPDQLRELKERARSAGYIKDIKDITGE